MSNLKRGTTKKSIVGQPSTKDVTNMNKEGSVERKETIGAGIEAQRKTKEEQEKKEQQEELRKKVIREQLLKDPIITYVEDLNKFEVEDALVFAGVAGEPEEWTNIPKLIARFLIRN